MENVTTKRIKVFAEEKTTGDGRKFTAFRAVTKNGALITAKFRQDCANIPKESGYITVPVDKMNIARNTEYPTLWVSEVLAFESLEASFDREKNLKEINETFG